jgi:hypothetical protein
MTVLIVPTKSSAASGDFNGDGKSDILWQDTSTGAVEIWLMNGTAKLSSGSPGSLGTEWSIVGVGDFNGDGDADILWRNTSTGEVLIWLMDGTAKTSSGSPGSLGLEWNIQGVGDFNGDGDADILWRNTNTGEVEIWLMDGTAKTSSGSPGGPATDWAIQGVGDYDGNGTADILWRNTSTGEVLVWLMAGTTRTASGSPGSMVNAWQIEPVVPNDYCSVKSDLCAILDAINNVRFNGSFGPGNPAPSATTGGPLDPLIWSVSAQDVAQNWVNQCTFGDNPDRGDYGETIFASPGGEAVTAQTIVSNWASEAADYTYSTNSCTGDICSDYTQLVWRSTTMVGCATRQCSTGSPFGSSSPLWEFAVCDYSPPGNVDAEEPY